MTRPRLLILGLLALLALVAALFLTRQQSASPPRPELPDALYPTLRGEVAAISAVRIFGAGDKRAVELLRKDADWTVTERSGYQADVVKVRKLLLAIVQAKPVEKKTSNPANYATLGVEDLSTTAASGVRIELAGIAPPVSLIVGKPAGGAQATYVRRAGESESWLVRQSFQASAQPDDWLRKDIIDVSADRIQSVAVNLGSGKAYTAAKRSRADSDFIVAGIPKGKQLNSPAAANDAASALMGLTLAAVRPLQDFAADQPAAHATFKTFDGLVVALDGWIKDDKHYVALRPSYDAALAKQFHVETKEPAKPANGTSTPAATAPTSPRAENVAAAAQVASARSAGWLYEIPDYKYEAIFTPLESLLKK